MSIIPNICNAIRSVTLTRTRFNKAINHTLTTRRWSVGAELGWIESGTSEGSGDNWCWRLTRQAVVRGWCSFFLPSLSLCACVCRQNTESTLRRNWWHLLPVFVFVWSQHFLRTCYFDSEATEEEHFLTSSSPQESPPHGTAILNNAYIKVYSKLGVYGGGNMLRMPVLMQNIPLFLFQKSNIWSKAGMCVIVFV